MNGNPLAKHYNELSAEERFALIFNAGARGDDAEQKRLLSSAPRITLSMSHTAPFWEAFQEIALGMLLELLDMAGEYFDALDRCRGDDGIETVQDTDEDADDAGDEDADEDEQTDDADGESCLSQRTEIFWATGFLFKIKSAGWKLWCERECAALDGATDQAVYDWLKDNLDDGEAFPSFATWRRYVTEARNANDTSKHTSRAGRTGRSIATPDQI